MAFAGLKQEERFKPENIMLVALARTKTYKKHGMARVLCGVDSDGVQHDEPCYAQDMRDLDAGVDMFIPDEVNGALPPATLPLTWTEDCPCLPQVVSSSSNSFSGTSRSAAITWASKAFGRSWSQRALISSAATAITTRDLLQQANLSHSCGAKIAQVGASLSV